MTIIVRVFVVISVLCFPSSILFAQGGATGAIRGHVQDATGAALTTAVVVATGVGAQRTTATDDEGDFTIPLLPPGHYHISITMTGFQDEQMELDVGVTETTHFVSILDIGRTNTQVTVHADIENIETGNATKGQSFWPTTITRLPLSTRNFQDLLALSSGATAALNQNASLGRGDVRINVNGQRDDNNNYLIEGITATDYNVAELTNTPLPSPDAIAEFRVQTSLYDATQGRNGGGNINAIFKSGSSQLHGSAFEFFRNDVLNANEYFLKQQDQPRPVGKQNIFGGSFGGPAGHSGKLGYFFLNYQGTRQVSGLTNGSIIETSIPVLPQDRSAQSLVNTFFPNSGVRASQIDPVALKLLNAKSSQFGSTPGSFLIPSVSGAPGGTGNFDVSRPAHYNDDQFTISYDRELGSKGKISGRFFYTDSYSNLPFGAGGVLASFGGSISRTDLNFPLELPINDRFVSIADTHTFSQAWLNEARFGYVRVSNQANNSPIITTDTLGIDRPNNNVDQSVYKFTFNSSGFQIGPTVSGNQLETQNNFIALDTMSYLRGRQFFRFGGEFDRVHLDKVFPQAFNGQMVFGSSSQTTDFQSFLLGSPVFAFGASGVANHKYRSNNLSLFLQDDYKITQRLTLNLGFRCEFVGAFYDTLDHIGNVHTALAERGLDPFVYPRGVSRLGVPGLTGAATETTLDNDYASNYGPRFGFAYDVDGHTVIRGGYGIYYVREDVGAVDNLSYTAPFLPLTVASGPPGTMGTLFSSGPGRIPVGGAIDPSFIPTFSKLLGFPDGDTTQAPTFSGTSVNLFTFEVPTHFVVPNTQQWNFGVQRSIGYGWVGELAYVGTKGTHLRETRDTNQAADARLHPVTVSSAGGESFTVTQNTAANVNARVPALGLSASTYQVFANDAVANYNSLQAAVTRRLSNGFEFQGAYTFSRSFDETSTGNTAFNTAVNDQTKLRGSYALSDYDRTQRLTLHYVYELPIFSGSHGFEKLLLANWAVSGITIFQSGTPITVLDSGAASAFGLSGSGTPTTPNLVGRVEDGRTHGDIHARLTHFLNPNAFAPAPVIGIDGSTGFGNLGRNTYRGPRQQNWDFSLAKDFRITEGHSLRFTTEFFDAFNHPVFSNPSFLDIESPANVGAITSTEGSPRLIQFAARYSF